MLSMKVWNAWLTKGDRLITDVHNSTGVLYMADQTGNSSYCETREEGEQLTECERQQSKKEENNAVSDCTQLCQVTSFF